MTRALLFAGWLNVLAFAVSPEPVEAVGAAAAGVAVGLLAYAHQITTEAGRS